MPEYFEQKVGGYKIDVKPRGRIRPYLHIGKWHFEPPYFVGSKIRLIVTFTKKEKNVEPLHSLANLIMYYPEYQGMNPSYRIKNIPPLGDKPVSINVESAWELSQDGTIRMYISGKDFISESGQLQDELRPLFSTGVLHRDYTNRDIFLVFLGMAGTLIVGIVLGFIKIDQAWHIWIPNWLLRLFR